MHIQFSFVQFSLLCYKFCILSKTECKSIYYHFRRDHESSSFRKLASNKWICQEICNFFRYQLTLLAINSINFFNLKTQNLDSPYILPEEFQKFIDNSSHDSFSILHLNIRSIKKNVDNFKLFFSTLGFSFSVICSSETWLDEVGISLYELANYISKHLLIILANKDLHIAGDFNLNLLHHESNKKVHEFLNIIYRNGMIPTINKPTRVPTTTGTAIDHILSNSFIDRNFKTAILKVIFQIIFLFALKYHQLNLK